MRPINKFLCISAVVTASFCGSSAFAATSASKACSAEAAGQHLSGEALKRFHASCMKGPLAPKTPTAPTGPGKEAHAVTAPSGADRTVRSKECAAEASKRGLATKERKEFQLSCLATAGPVSEGETHAETPKPAKAIPGIGINNNKPPH